MESRTLLAVAPSGRFEVLWANTWDIPRFVEEGWADLGITGSDVVEESGAKVDLRRALPFGYCRLMLAVPSSTNYRSLRDLPSGVRIATSYPRITREALAKRGLSVTIVELRGGVEAAPAAGAADGIADLVATGQTLRENRLRPIEELGNSQVVLIGSGTPRPEAVDLERQIDAAVRALDLRHISARIPAGAERASPMSTEGWVGVSWFELREPPGDLGFSAAVPIDAVDACVQMLERRGARDILVLPVHRVIP